MKTGIIVAIIIGAIVASIGFGYMIYLINEPKTAADCRMTYGKGTTEMFECLEKIKEKIATQSHSKIGPLNLYHQQCAQLFDSNLEAWSPPGSNYNPPTLTHIILGSPEFQEFRASDCRSSIFDWAYLSENEKFIWNSNMQWPEFTQWPESETVYGVCGPGGIIQADGYCYKDGKRVEFKNTEFEPENKKCFNNYGNGTRIEISCEGIPFSSSPESFDSYKQESEQEDAPLTFDYVIEKDGVTYGSQYEISGGTVDEIVYDKNSSSLIISLNEATQGYIQIVIQTGLLHNFGQLQDYMVIADGEEVTFEQLSPILLKIPFEKGTRQIEILGTFET